MDALPIFLYTTVSFLLVQMESEGTRLIERVAACLPCYSCGTGRNWQLWPGDFDEDAQPILTAPTPALAECLIPPSMADPFKQQHRAMHADATWASSNSTLMQVYIDICLSQKKRLSRLCDPSCIHEMQDTIKVSSCLSLVELSGSASPLAFMEQMGLCWPLKAVRDEVDM